ncbi:MAG TPA: prolyl oligopeptidase family serine peptidase [Nevskiaceae bacterium]|nr:prolyl oligopeptidase family serine peptidase [Nevskiaceae bacterium]
MIEGGYSELELPKPKQYEKLSWVPILAGLYWLTASQGGHWLVFAAVPGSLLLMSGLALFLMPGNPRITAYMALAAALGIVLSLLAMFSGGFAAGFVAMLGSMASFLTAGRVGLMREPLYKGAVPPVFSSQLDLKAALDEFVLGYFVLAGRLPSGELVQPMVDAVARLEGIFRERGWEEDPRGFHPAPPPPERTWFEHGRIFGMDYDVLRFDSGYAPEDALPGAALWKSHTRNYQCAVRILRHEGPPRPWIFCIHGYRMGEAWMDFGLFPPQVLHEKLGLNVIQPVLPLHGPRRIGPKSGDHFLDWDLLDLVYAEGQTLWDLRRTLAWLRAQEPDARVGVLGYSLGGYNASLLAAYEKQLDFVIAGIPVTDFSTALWRFIPTQHREFLESHGLTSKRYRDLLRVVSPLQVKPLLDKERLLIYAATGDRIVPPWHPLQLGKHWDVPITWYQGSHLSVRRERETRQVLKEAMLRAGWLVG